jgi:hypothetical protein
MKRDTALIRIRFPFPTLERLDTLALEIRKLIKRRVARARLVRALVGIALETALAPELATAIKADTVRQGRMKARRA